MLVDIPLESAAPPQLSEHYHQSRTQYTLVSGLLLAYVLIGINLPDDGKLIPNAAVSLKNPDALPLIFATLLVYFAYRVTIEWNQCDERRRATRVSRTDFLVAHALGMLSISAYLIDRALQVGLGALAVAYAPEGLFLLLWIIVSVEAPLLLRVSLESLLRGGRRRSGQGWVRQVDASMTPVFVALVCLALLGLTLVFVLDSVSNLSSTSSYYLIRNLTFAAITFIALFIPRRLHSQVVPSVLLSLAGHLQESQVDQTQRVA